ncbi:MAG: hypothetical protein INF52_01040 [Rhodobacter sp.]|nr:hypothetical protein [Rhodobacter sp.]
MLRQTIVPTAEIHTPHIGRAEYVEDEFIRAKAPGRDVPYHFSHALDALHRHAMAKPGTIPRTAAANIERAIDDASPLVLDLFHAPADRRFARQALAKTKVLARHWAGDVDPHGGGAILCAARYVLWLKNHCHNFALLDEIEHHHTAKAREAMLVRQGGVLPPGKPKVATSVFDT